MQGVGQKETPPRVVLAATDSKTGPFGIEGTQPLQKQPSSAVSSELGCDCWVTLEGMEHFPTSGSGVRLRT